MPLIPFMLATAPPPPPPTPPPGRVESVTVFRSLTIRMPLLHRAAPSPGAMVERRGPKCIPANAIAGIGVAAPDAVDFVLRGGAYVRARLEDACPGLGFYGGLYVDHGDDGRICAGREAIHTRAGGECGIDRFRKLEPAKPRKP